MRGEKRECMRGGCFVGRLGFEGLNNHQLLDGSTKVCAAELAKASTIKHLAHKEIQIREL